MTIETEKIPYFFSISFLIEALTPGKLSTVSSMKGLKDLNINKFILASADLYQVLSETVSRGLSGKEVNLGECVREVLKKSMSIPLIKTNISLGYTILSVSIVYALTSAIRLDITPSLNNLSIGHGLLKNSLIHESAANLYEGIRLAAEKHLGRYFGRIPDVHEKLPESLSVWEVLKASSSDDSVAYEVINGFPKTSEVCRQLRNYVGVEGINVLEAVRKVQLDLLSKYPDTLITKALGYNTAVLLKELARLSKIKRSKYFCTLDTILRNAGINPGTTSDILSAGLGLYLVMSFGGLNC